MSGTHKYPTISFRISPRDRQERNSLSDCGTVAGNGESAGGTGGAN